MIYLFICLPLQLVGIPLVALAVLVQPWDAYRLPKFLKWFDLADNYPEEFARSNETYVAQILPAGKFARFNYIALRNPTNYFCYKYLSVKFLRISAFGCSRSLQPDYLDAMDPELAKVLLLQDIGDNGVSGLSEIEIDGITIDDTAKHVWEYYRIYRYTIFGITKCVRIRIGWKLSEFSDENQGKWLQWVFVISPFHSFTGTLPNGKKS